jgi:transcriptional regulator with XRE-family HTH domain
MTGDMLPGGIQMVKIDGARVRRLREQKGLTQLYVATAVQVTTDTISRWENKRYPSIKKENCVKLAEALEVPLEDILEQQENHETESGNEEPQQETGEAIGKQSVKNPILLVSGILLILAALGLAAWYFFLQPEEQVITARRILPKHCQPGQPFPVIIEVTASPAHPVTLILREILPAKAELNKTAPSLSAPAEKGKQSDKELKWLEKINGPTRFIYTATLQGAPGEAFHFSGDIAVSQDSEKARAVVGNDTISTGIHHWADANADGILSDKEMLVVHDQYSGSEKLGIDIARIEKIWQGSGYRWNEKKSTYEILP